MPEIFFESSSLAGLLVQWPVIILGSEGAYVVEAPLLLVSNVLWSSVANVSSSSANVSTSSATCGESMKWSPPIKA